MLSSILCDRYCHEGLVVEYLENTNRTRVDLDIGLVFLGLTMLFERDNKISKDLYNFFWKKYLVNLDMVSWNIDFNLIAPRA